MRILHIVTGMDPEGGGPQEAVRMLLVYSPAGVDNEIATLDDPDAAFLQSSSLPIHALGRRGGGWYSPHLMPWLRANRSRFDGVLHHGLWGFPSVATLHTIAGHRPFQVFPHGMLDPYFKRAFPAKHLKKLPFWFLNERALLRRAERVLFTAVSERDLATESFPFSHWQPAVVPLGTDMPAVALEEAKTSFERRFPQLAAQRFLLFLGRLHPKKGCDLLLQAFAAVSATDPALHLVMAGPDAIGWRPELEAIASRGGIADRVHWPGMLRGAEKWGAFAACEAFVLPSHQENFGIAIVEALACGRPVLLSEPINIAADLAGHGCALVAPDTLDGTRDLLARWMGTPHAERTAMSDRALHTFRQHYDMRRNAAAVFAGFAAGSQLTPHPAPAEAL